MTRRPTSLIALAMTMALLATLAISEARAETTPGLTPIPSEYVCMMNDKRFAEPQIPVEVEGRTYYGCCAMCKQRLSNDPNARAAVDPVSSARVDKATAVIGAAANGRVFYFENAANLATFSAKLSAAPPQGTVHQ